MITYIFFRAEGFYFAEYPNDHEATKGAEHNSGTMKVVRARDNEIVWQKVVH